jgi:hypothetical protein
MPKERFDPTAYNWKKTGTGGSMKDNYYIMLYILVPFL